MGVLFPSDRRPEIKVESAPKAPAVDVTITSALTPFSRVTAFWTLLPPDWYVSSATIFPPSCFQRALNAWTTLRK